MQTIELARDQAVWSHASVWVQVVGLFAACLAAIFAWQAARASRRQADTAQQELSQLSGAREAESRVRAWELRALLRQWFTTPPRKIRNEALPELIKKIAKRIDTQHQLGIKETPWDELGATGFQLAVGVNSPRVVPLWIALIDGCESLLSWGPRLSADRTGFMLHAANNPDTELILMSDDDLEAAWAAQADNVATARAEYEQFWSTYNQLLDEVDAIARGGNLSGVMRAGAKVTSTLSTAS